MQGASAQRVSSNAGREKEHVLAEFAYQPAAQSARHNGVGSASNGEVIPAQLQDEVSTHNFFVCQLLYSCTAQLYRRAAC